MAPIIAGFAVDVSLAVFVPRLYVWQTAGFNALRQLLPFIFLPVRVRDGPVPV